MRYEWEGGDRETRIERNDNPTNIKLHHSQFGCLVITIECADGSPLGNANTRYALVSFFKEHFDTNLNIQSTTIESHVNKGQFVEDFRVQFIKTKSNPYPDVSVVKVFRLLCQLAAVSIGIPDHDKADEEDEEDEIFVEFEGGLKIESLTCKK